MLHFTPRCQLRHYRRRVARSGPPKLPMQRLDDRSRPPAGPGATIARLAALRQAA